MASRAVKLSEVAEITVGFVGSMASEYRPEGVPFLRSLNVRPHEIDVSDVKFISPEFHRRLAKSALRPGDVVTVRTGKPGQTTIIPEWLPIANCSDLVIFRPGQELDGLWLSYYLNSVTATDISSQLVGAVQQHFNVKAAQNLTVYLPEVSSQRAIAEVLGALDDKIAANDGVVQKIEALAGALYTAAADTNVVPLSSLARFVNGRNFTKNATGSGRVVIRIAELNSGIGPSTVSNDVEVPDEHVARPGDLLFAWSGSLTVRRWFRPEGIVNQHIFKVIPNDGVPLWLVAQALRAKLSDFRAIASGKATTMGHIQRGHLDEPVQLPRPDVVATLGPLMSALWDRALAGEVETLRLTAARDELLPLLMSGKVTVREAAQTVSDIT